MYVQADGQTMERSVQTHTTAQRSPLATRNFKLVTILVCASDDTRSQNTTAVSFLSCFVGYEYTTVLRK